MGEFDVSPYLQYEAFESLKNPAEFSNIFNGGISLSGVAALISRLTQLKVNLN